MMDGGQPEQKRPRLVGPPPGSWHNSPESARQLLPPLPPPHSQSYPQHPTPFSRPEPPSHTPHPLDRRPSDHTQYDPQDSRRPNSGPSHGYHPPHSAPPQFPGRQEPMIKRDPSDEPPHPHFRPPSTGNGQDHNANHPPPHHEPPRHYLPPFENAHARAPYPPSPYPPTLSPMTTAEPYQYGPGAAQPPRDQYPSVSYPPSGRNDNNGPRKKATRAAQACDSCRTLKAKCDEGRPSCTSCKDKQMDCRYRDPPPKQQDKASADIMDMLVQFRNDFGSYNSQSNAQMKVLIAKVDRMENFLVTTVPNAAASLKGEPDAIPYSRPPIPAELQPLPLAQSPHTSSMDAPQLPMPDTVYPVAVVAEDEDEEDGGADVGPTKDPSIPVNHTTGAARLLLEPCIREMVGPMLTSEKIRNEKYPFLQETKRGLLRLYGRGEGNECLPGYDTDPLTDHGADSTPGDNGSTDYPSPAGEEWGQIGGLTPPGNPPPDIQRGAINGEGMPDLSRDVVYSLVQSYKENLNNMHPILIPSRLDALVEKVLRSIPESQAKPKQISAIVNNYSTTPHQPLAGFVGGGYKYPESPGQKRKRSPGMGDYTEPPNLLDHKPGHPFRSIGTALVLLVMALGKICQHKGKLPDVYHDRENETSYGSSPTIRNGHPPSPLQGSPVIPASMMASPMDTDRSQPRSRRSSMEGPYLTRGFAGAKPRNLDVIPGLSYFALATDIIGNQLGGNSLQHVHVCILAGLYHAQLARVMESHAYIAAACRSLQVILRPKLDRWKKMKDDQAIIPAKDNPLIFAFWTCLQLESDIVAELPCPHSGILTYEEDMPGPNLQAAADIDGFDARILESYSAQLFLRKHLNQLHNMFYKPDNDSQFPSVFAGKDPKHFVTIDAAQDNLNAIKGFARTMYWDVDRGEPAEEILGARLRAKYYGAQVITYRYFVLQILNFKYRGIPSGQGEQASNKFVMGIKVPAIEKNSDIDPKVLEYAENGIRALVHSTRAFHGLGLGTRPIVTNIWGTAHAQWGNMLILQAVHKDPTLAPILERIISRPNLEALLEQTIAFLKLVAMPSSALWTDFKLLEYSGKHNGLWNPDRHSNQSFSSQSA